MTAGQILGKHNIAATRWTEGESVNGRRTPLRLLFREAGYMQDGLDAVFSILRREDKGIR